MCRCYYYIFSNFIFLLTVVEDRVSSDVSCSTTMMLTSLVLSEMLQQIVGWISIKSGLGIHIRLRKEL